MIVSKYAFGVDIGGTTAKLGLFEHSGKLLEKWEIPTGHDNEGKDILPNIAESILGKMKEYQMTPDQVEGVGVGAPGAVDDEGVLVNGAVNLGWGVFNLSEALGNLLKVKVYAANDANVAAYGEMWQGGGKGYSSIVMVTLGTGVGGGIIINGRMINGATGGAGEIGHIHMNDEETEACGCKKKGCLEQYASATGIVRLARRRLVADNIPSMLRAGELSAKAVFDAVKAQDKVAISIAEEFGEYLGKGLANVADVVNPQAFVIGGGVSKAGEVLLGYVEPAFQKYVFGACNKAKFCLATLGNDAGIYGSAYLVIHKN